MEAARASAARRALRWHSALIQPRNWVCRSCHSQFTAVRRFAIAPTPTEKPYYVTTPIFYVNAGTRSSKLVFVMVPRTDI